MYDFDSDGYIDKEDVRLIMTHIPVDNTIQENLLQEGKYSSESGANRLFLDRIQTQDEIKLLLDEVYGSKKRLNYEDFKSINLDQTSEMFLSLMLMIQSSLPCSENFFRYK
jgi:Ca2+-binding EF-hand superfamily protein